MFHRILVAAGLAVLVLLPASTLAQAPDHNRAPVYGEVDLRSGFLPDPHVVEIVAGGSLDAQDALAGLRIGNAGDGRCRGTIHGGPDLRLRYSAGSSLPLIIRAVSSMDNTLVVRGPNGTWYCDDDSGSGLNAELHFGSPQSGRYDIWVGAYRESGNFEEARIEISELSDDRTFSDLGGPMLDPGLYPEYGEVTLRAGFRPDPHVTEVEIGGWVDVQEAMEGLPVGNVGDGRCRGFVFEEPDLTLHYSAGSILPLIIRAVSSFDNTLVAMGPDGTWYCDDDSGSGLNALLRFNDPESGQYDIWVGAYSSDRFDGTVRLEISELD